MVIFGLLGGAAVVGIIWFLVSNSYAKKRDADNVMKSRAQDMLEFCREQKLDGKGPDEKSNPRVLARDIQSWTYTWRADDHKIVVSVGLMRIPERLRAEVVIQKIQDEVPGAKQLPSWTCYEVQFLRAHLAPLLDLPPEPVAEA